MFCIGGIRTENKPNANAFAKCIIESVMHALQLGDCKAQQLIPNLLSLIESNVECQMIFAQKVCVHYRWKVRLYIDYSFLDNIDRRMDVSRLDKSVDCTFGQRTFVRITFVGSSIVDRLSTGISYVPRFKEHMCILGNLLRI